MVPMDDQVGVGGSRRRDLLNPLPGCVIILPAGSDGFHVDPAPPAVSPFDAEINRFRRRAQARLVQKLIRRTEIVENLSGSAQLASLITGRKSSDFRQRKTATSKRCAMAPASENRLSLARRGSNSALTLAIS